MKLLLLAILVVVVSPLRPKRTIGVVFRGLVDAHTRTTPSPNRKDDKVEKIRSPPPTTVYIIPIPERDKRAEAQLLSAVHAFKLNLTDILQKDNSITEGHMSLEKRNATLQEPKQFIIRIAGQDGKSVLMRITGDDVKLKKTKEGYNIAISNQESQANIKVELPEKQETYKIEGFEQLFIPARFSPFIEQQPQKLQSFDPQHSATSIEAQPLQSYHQQLRQLYQNYQQAQSGYPPAQTNPKKEVSSFTPTPTAQLYLQPPKNDQAYPVRHQEEKPDLHLTVNLQEQVKQSQKSNQGAKIELEEERGTGKEQTSPQTPYPPVFPGPGGYSGPFQQFPGFSQFQYPQYVSQFSSQYPSQLSGQYPSQYSSQYPLYQGYLQNNFPSPYFGLNRNYARQGRSVRKTFKNSDIVGV